MAQQKQSAIGRILALQVIVVGWATMLFWIFQDGQYAYSALLGGLAALIPNAYLARKVVASSGGPAKQVVRAFYRGETVKLLATAILFYLIFLLPDIRYLAVFTAFMAALMVFWVALLMRKTE